MIPSKKKKTFRDQFNEDVETISNRVRNADSKIEFAFQQDIKRMRANVKSLDARLEEIHPIWLEHWRLQRRKEKIERRLKRYSH